MDEREIRRADGAFRQRDPRAERDEERGRARRERRSRRDAQGPLTPEQEAYREAQRVARRKLGFVFHLVPYVMTCVFLLLTTRSLRVAGIVAFSWGIGVACHWASVMAPRLRRRWIEQEVRRQVGHSVGAERRALEGAHARSLEALSASIAHEIRNPITAAKSLVQQMGEDPASRENIEYARVALEELDRVERSISHLLRFAREEALRISDVRLSQVLEGALDTFRERVTRSGVHVVRAFDGAGTLRGDPEKLRRVAINLIGNALDALERGATPSPRLELAAGESLAGSEVWLSVRDNGPGLSPDSQGRIFDPFYTEKPDGTGLGLAITKKLVEAHRGSIEVRSAPGEGTEFVVTFPRSGPEGEGGSPPALIGAGGAG